MYRVRRGGDLQQEQRRENRQNMRMEKRRTDVSHQSFHPVFHLNTELQGMSVIMRENRDMMTSLHKTTQLLPEVTHGTVPRIHNRMKLHTRQRSKHRWASTARLVFPKTGLP